MDISCPTSAAPRTVASCFWTHVAEHASESAFVQNAKNVQDHDITCAVTNPTSSSTDWLSWGELGTLAAQRVAALRQLKLKPGQHVASCLTNSLEWILIDIALQTLGLVHVAIDPREAAIQRNELFQLSQARYLFDESTDLLRETADVTVMSQAECRRLAEQVSPNAAAQMLFTSGSAGSPKGVVLSHRNLLSNARSKLLAAPQVPADLRLNLLPFAHAYARTCELTAWILSRSRLAIASSWTEMQHLARRLRPTLINVVPYLAERLAEALEDDPQALGGRLRLLQVGGAALPDDLWERLRRLGLPPLQGYGLTEAAPVVCSNRAGQQRPGSVGPPVAGVDLRLDSSGVLWCRGPNVMLGYWQNPSATAASLVDGWLCTGDLAEFTSDRHVRILGRASQQIVLSTGYKVSPELIERELNCEAGIERALVFGHGRPHVVALLWPRAADDGRLVDPKNCSKTWQARIAARLERFPRYAIPCRFAWIRAPLTRESGLLTAKGSPRRERIADHFRDTLANLYTAAPTEPLG